MSSVSIESPDRTARPRSLVWTFDARNLKPATLGDFDVRTAKIPDHDAQVVRIRASYVTYGITMFSCAPNMVFLRIILIDDDFR